jgi:hypothetical protein
MHHRKGQYNDGLRVSEGFGTSGFPYNEAILLSFDINAALFTYL